MQTQTVKLYHPAKNTANTADKQNERWSVAEIEALFKLPFADLLYQAQTVHRAHFDPNRVQLSTLLSIKTGGCSEDCGYCPQAARYSTDVEAELLLDLDTVMTAARAASSTVSISSKAWLSTPVSWRAACGQ